MAQNTLKEITTTASATPTTQQVNRGLFEFRNLWDALTDPAKVRATGSPKQQLREARAKMVCAIVGSLVLLLLRKLFPTLLILTGLAEMLAMWFGGQMIFEAVRFDRNLSEERRRAERTAGRMLSSYIIWVVVLTVLAGWISTGPAWAENFPVLKQLANYQLGMVNELIDFLRERLGKLL